MTPKGRSIEEQKARLLNKTGSSKSSSQYSKKYLQKEIINRQYGIFKKQVKTKTNIAWPILMSLATLGIVSFFSNFFNALFVSASVFIISFLIFNTFKSALINSDKVQQKKYNIDFIFQNHHLIFTDLIKKELLIIKEKLEIITPNKTDLHDQYYLESTTQKDLPEIFSHYQSLIDSKSQNIHTFEEEIIKQLIKVRNKVSLILTEQEKFIENKFKVKAKIIEHKSEI